MSLGACLRVWIALWALEVLLTVTFAPQGHLSQLAESEFRQLSEAQPQHAKLAVERVTSLLPRLPALRDFTPSAPENTAMEGGSRAIEAVARSLRALVVLALFRLSASGEWVIAWLVCGWAAAADGLMVRRRRAFTFTTTSTALYNMAGYVLICAIMSAGLCLAAPIGVPLAVAAAIGVAFVAASWALCAHLPGPATLLGMRS